MNGILLIDKPAGWTSMDVCAKLRGVLHEKRIGHSGTLDPMATGLLVVFLGRATRAVEFAEADAKTYEAGLRLGLVTDTQDVTGTVLSRQTADISPEELEKALAAFRGEIDQIPPMYSAIKINGQKLCNLARKGREVERKPRRITIFSLEQTGRNDDGDWRLLVRCSKGTYIRTLCHDIGATLGCGGVMSALRRTQAGAFDISQAHSMEEVVAAAEQGNAERMLLPVDLLFSGFDARTLTPAQEKVMRNGGSFSAQGEEGTLFRLYSGDGAFIALGRYRDGAMHSEKSFFEV